MPDFRPYVGQGMSALNP